MTRFDIGQTTTPTTITDETIDSESTEGPSDQKETFWYNSNFTKWYGNYKNVAKVKIPINAYATWVVGQGWTASTTDTVFLENIRGWGEDSFLSILWNMLVIKKVNGDSYAEIIINEQTGTLLNLKPLDPASIVHVVDNNGIIIRYEQISKTKKGKKKIPVNKMFHLCNDRVADNIHGTSIIEALVWNMEAQEEARKTHRKMVRRNGVVKIIEIDVQDTAKRDAFKKEWKTAIENGDVLILPKGVAEAKDWHGTLDTNGVIQWLNYLDDEAHMMSGMPKVILGGSSENEGDKKMSYLAFEQVYKREVNELKADIWNQLAIRIEFNKPASLQAQLADNELKNTSQVGLQPNDTTAGVGE